MSRKAAGAYLQRLREHSGVSRLALSRQLETSDSQIMRIENGDQETRGSLLAALIRALNGSADDVVDLLLDKEATAEEAFRMADLRYEQVKANAAEAIHTSVHPDVQVLLQKLTSYELGRWVSMGERIIEERNKLK